MPCQEFEEQLLDYDLLSAGERNVVDLHTSDCDGCRTFLSALNEVDSVLTPALSHCGVSRDFSEAVLQSVRKQAPLRRPSVVPEMLDAVGWAAIVAIVLGLAMFFFPGLDFSSPVAAVAGIMVLMAGFWIAYRSYTAMGTS